MGKYLLKLYITGHTLRTEQAQPRSLADAGCEHGKRSLFHGYP